MSTIRGARFLLSIHDARELPPDVGSEVAFAGRSNAGKSSAINALAGHRRLAFVSKTPGRTQTINFFECGLNRRLVDLPGYGYAAVPLRERAHWGELISTYLTHRESLKGLVLLVDARHRLSALDHQLLRWYKPSGQPVLVLLTKSDKLTRQAANAALTCVKVELESRYPAAEPALFSAVSGTGWAAADRFVRRLLEQK